MTLQPATLDVAAHVVALLRSKGQIFSCAESCTGGLLSAALTSVPGSSAVFDRAFITYSNLSKTDLLDVPASLLEHYGAVSREVAQAMARGALRAGKAHVALGITGIAGPGGGTPEKPVGRVHIALATPGAIQHRSCDFAGQSRDSVRDNAVHAALVLLHEHLER